MTHVERVEVTVVLRDQLKPAGGFTIVVDEPEPRGGNPAFLSQQIDAALAEVGMRAALIVESQHGRQLAPEPLVKPEIMADLVERFGWPPGTDRAAEKATAVTALREAARQAGEKPDNGRVVRFLARPGQEALQRAAFLEGEFLVIDGEHGIYRRHGDAPADPTTGNVQVNTDAIAWEYVTEANR